MYFSFCITFFFETAYSFLIFLVHLITRNIVFQFVKYCVLIQSNSLTESVGDKIMNDNNLFSQNWYFIHELNVNCCFFAKCIY